jgi:hypothetical protein
MGSGWEREPKFPWVLKDKTGLQIPPSACHSAIYEYSRTHIQAAQQQDIHDRESPDPAWKGGEAGH